MAQQNLADRIQQLRKQNGLSQEQLAEKLHVSRQAVSKWESAQAQPDLDKILAMSELFLVTTDYLLKGTPPERPARPGMNPALASRALYFAVLFFLAIGLVCAAALWYDRQDALSIAIGWILQAVGLVCYAVGRLLSRERPARWMAKTGCVVVLFLPLAVLAWQLEYLIPVPHFSFVTEGAVLAAGYAAVLTLLTRLHLWDRM